jgi:hypothetical protein
MNMKKKKKIRKIDFVNYAQLNADIHKRIKDTKHPGRVLAEAAFFILILVIFGFKITGYLHANIFNPVTWAHGVEKGYNHASYKVSELKYFGKCPGGEQKIDIGREYLCRQPTQASVYQKIYDTDPRDPNGKETIYPFFNDWSQKKADDLVNNTYDIDRYKPVKLAGAPTWTEDPYQDRYWRFNFYSLRDMKDLLDAAYQTHDPRYSNKMVSDLNSFLDHGMNQPHSWDDFHGVAWRSMMLADSWYKLRAINALPISTSNKLLAAIEQHGQFLMSTSHYEPEYNHGTNEAAALYQLGVDFPQLPNAAQWKQVGRQRLADTLGSLVNKDGSLDEHSPYYDFYVLSKYYDLNVYSERYDKSIAPLFNQKLPAMINYATYILQPDLHVPLIGSSLDESIHNSDEYAEMADANPQFKYVLTKGLKGTPPKQNNVVFPDTGQTVMRSGWAAKNYTQQTQVIFNYGAYVTAHSHLDSLSLELYGAGKALLPGPGLYTYDLNDLHNYFHGTSSHNAVTVDGHDQQEGSGVAGKFTQQGGVVSQSASDQLYPGVTQERQVIMLDRYTVLVIDKEHSATSHNYEQQFHLFPGAKLSQDGLSVVAEGSEPTQRLQITQLNKTGLTKKVTYNQTKPPISGLCSQQYGVLLPCYQVSYGQQAKDATYVTLLQIGKQNPATTYSMNGDTVTVHSDGKTYTVAIQETQGHDAKVTATAPQPPEPDAAIIDNMTSAANWQENGGQLTTVAGSGDDPNSKALALTSSNGNMATITKPVSLDLSNKNVLFGMNIPNAANVDDLSIRIYSGGTYATENLKNVYDNTHDNDLSSTTATGTEQITGWSQISLAKSMQRSDEGQWIFSAPNFDWSHITAVSFQLRANAGVSTSVQLQNLSTYPEQTSGKVVIVFDDGSSSIQPAITSMNKYGMKGNVAVIGKYPDTALSGYLSVSALRQLQSQGWSMVNHSYYHQDAVATYYDQNNMAGFQADVLKGAEFLEKNGIDTDPNWYVYPHGTTNAAIEAVLAKYYKFARSELTAPEAFPFGEPLAVKDYIVENDTTPQEVENAVADANKYHQTLLLTFHRIHASASDESGYDINNFNALVDYLHTSKTQVMTFNQLDKSNGVSINHFKIVNNQPEELSSTVSPGSSSLWHKLKNFF